MEAFVWNERFVTGVASVDEQHKHLFDLANQVGEMLLQTKLPDAVTIEGLFRELATYANIHFRDEEQLMQAARLDAAHFEHHVKSHREFIEQVRAMWAQRSTMSAPAETLHGFLVAWLSFHILGEDMAMAQKMRCAAGQPGADDPAHGDRSTGALLEALSRLYGVLSKLNRDLEVANRDLESKVAQRTQELLQSEKMASVGQLAAGVAHEINNPIGFVVSNLGTLGRYAEQLLKLAELGAATPAGQGLKREIDLDYLRTDIKDLLQESQEGLDRVRKIVMNLKDFAHLDEAEWQQADLLAGLESTLTVALHKWKDKAEVVRQLTPLPDVRCMPAQINQVFLNLLVNAAQAITGHGTITLRSGKGNDGFVWVEVADTGCGMDENTRQRMCDPFFTTKPVGTGTGLGMAVTYDIIKKHGGRIDVESALGQGTRMRVVLPVDGP